MEDLAHTIRRAVREASAARNGLAVAAALNCIEPSDLAAFFHHSLPADLSEAAVGEGLPASPGAASGRIVLTSDDAIVAGDKGEAVILVRSETTPDDVLGMQASRGILTVRGGLVSHAAVVARGWGIPAVVGASGVHIAGDTVTHRRPGAARRRRDHHRRQQRQDLSSGHSSPPGSEAPAELRPCSPGPTPPRSAPCRCAPMRTPPVTPASPGRSAHRASGSAAPSTCSWPPTGYRSCGASSSAMTRRPRPTALAELEAAQIVDFESVLEAMDGLPVTVRLLDPPLHEFLPDLVDLSVREALGTLSEEERVEIVRCAASTSRTR